MKEEEINKMLPFGKKFSKGEAFLDCLHNTEELNKKTINSIAKRWGWSYHTAKNYLSVFANINTNVNIRKTVLLSYINANINANILHPFEKLKDEKIIDKIHALLIVEMIPLTIEQVKKMIYDFIDYKIFIGDIHKDYSSYVSEFIGKTKYDRRNGQKKQRTTKNNERTSPDQLSRIYAKHFAKDRDGE